MEFAQLWRVWGILRNSLFICYSAEQLLSLLDFATNKRQKRNKAWRFPLISTLCGLSCGVSQQCYKSQPPILSPPWHTEMFYGNSQRTCWTKTWGHSRRGIAFHSLWDIHRGVYTSVNRSTLPQVHQPWNWFYNGYCYNRKGWAGPGYNNV